MALAEEGSWSGLNPAAPTFVPAAYRRVEDFSPEWWHLVLTSPCFRDYWLSHFPDGQYDVVSEDEEASFEDDDDVFLPGNELGNGPQENGSALPMPRNAFKTDVEALLKDVKVPKSMKPVSPKCSAGIPKYQKKKAAYYMSPKPTPMRINQPR